MCGLLWKTGASALAPVSERDDPYFQRDDTGSHSEIAFWEKPFSKKTRNAVVALLQWQETPFLYCYIITAFYCCKKVSLGLVDCICRGAGFFALAHARRPRGKDLFGELLCIFFCLRAVIWVGTSAIFGPPGLENSPRDFILTPWGAPSGSQKLAENLVLCLFFGLSGRWRGANSPLMAVNSYYHDDKKALGFYTIGCFFAQFLGTLSSAWAYCS